jgi:predicted dehydrogenase
MKKVRFGIIGVGNMGYSHAKNMLEGHVENGCLSAVCDLKQEKLDKVKELEGAESVKTFTDYREMLASGVCDAIVVAVPHYDHPCLVIDALESGHHVVCEKPAGVYTKQVKEMNAVAARSNKLFTMMFNQRTNCVYRKMHDMIADGELGDIKRIIWTMTNWYRPQSYYDSGDWRATWKGEGGGVLFNQCPHQLDLIQWIPNLSPVKVRAFCHYGKWHDIEVEDDVTAYMEYANGATGVFITSTADAPGTNRLEILGDKGQLICEYFGKEFGTESGKRDKLTFIKNSISEREFNKTCTANFGAPEKEVINVETDGSNPQHVGIFNNLANAILGIEPLFVDGKEGINGVELMDAMQLSGWLKEEVTLPIDDDLYWEELQKKIATGRTKEAVISNVVTDMSNTF